MNIEQSAAQIGVAIERRRGALGLTQIQVCNLAGVGHSFLHQLEHGKPTVRLNKLLEVLEVLGLGLQLRESDQLVVVTNERRSEDA